jgi:hypothetical protein
VILSRHHRVCGRRSWAVLDASERNQALAKGVTKAAMIPQACASQSGLLGQISSPQAGAAPG